MTMSGNARRQVTELLQRHGRLPGVLVIISTMLGGLMLAWGILDSLALNRAITTAGSSQLHRQLVGELVVAYLGGLLLALPLWGRVSGYIACVAIAALCGGLLLRWSPTPLGSLGAVVVLSHALQSLGALVRAARGAWERRRRPVLLTSWQNLPATPGIKR